MVRRSIAVRRDLCLLPADPDPGAKGASAAAPIRGDAVRAWDQCDDPMANLFVASGTAAPTAEHGQVQRSPEARRAIERTIERLDRSPERLGGWSPAAMYQKFFANNPSVSDEQLLAMGKVPVNRLNTPEATATELQEMSRYDVPLNTPQHRFARDLMAGIIDARPGEVSRIKPEMGTTGSSRFTSEFRKKWWGLPPPVGLSISSSEPLQLGTVLHDVTSDLKDAGVANLNKSMWGLDGNRTSAIVMSQWYGGLPALPPPTAPLR